MLTTDEAKTFCQFVGEGVEKSLTGGIGLGFATSADALDFFNNIQ